MISALLYWFKLVYGSFGQSNKRHTSTQSMESFTTSKTDRHLLCQKVRQRISVMKTNTAVFVVFKTKRELKCQFSGITEILWRTFWRNKWWSVFDVVKDSSYFLPRSGRKESNVPKLRCKYLNAWFECNDIVISIYSILRILNLKGNTFSIRWFCIRIKRVMTVYGNYDVIAFRSCIQVFTV